MSSMHFCLEGKRKSFLFIISPCLESVPKIQSIPQFFKGSFAVDFGDHLRSRIICGPLWGSLAVSGSFAVGDHLQYCTELREKLWQLPKVNVSEWTAMFYLLIELEMRWRLNALKLEKP